MATTESTIQLNESRKLLEELKDVKTRENSIRSEECCIKNEISASFRSIAKQLAEFTKSLDGEHRRELRDQINQALAEVVK